MTSRHFANAIFAMFLSSSLLPISALAAGQIIVKDQSEFQKALSGLKPGDTVALANGVWNNFEILFVGEGSAEKPITLTAETKGKVTISGQSNLRIAGEHLVVSGLVFKNGYSPTDSVISFRKSKNELANHSRVTEMVVDNFNNPERVEVDYYVAMYGKHNRFDHNHLEGKRNKGVTMAVILDTEASQENHHRIDHNYFGPRPVLGSNGGETLRIGTSAYSLTNSFTLVENNYFDCCDGEVEIVSVKSGRNHLRGNLFYESQGGLALRHGNNNLVEANVFLGNGVAHTGGIRVINRGQIIRNNYLEGLTGTRFGAGLVVMNGVPDSPINKYHQVDGALIENNTLVNIDHIQLAEGRDEWRTAAPIRSEFRNNLIFNQNGRDIFSLKDDVSGIRFSNNVLNNVENPRLSDGFTSRDVVMTRGRNGLLYPESAELEGIGASRDLVVLDKNQTGAPWYPKSDPSIRFGTGRTVDIKPEPAALENAIKQAQTGDVIRLAPGNYVVSKILQIDKPLTVSADGNARIAYERTTLFEIADGGSLQLRGLAISGKSTPDNVGNSVIRSSRYSMLVNHQISVENCEITDLVVNRAFNFFYASKQTMADSVDIIESRFRNITGAILKLDNENDDEGIYNADYVRIRDSSFIDVQGALVDLYRGGTDESTFGPHFSLTGSELRAVGTGRNNKSGASVHLHGVQVATIENNVFSGSAPIRIFHTVGDPVTRIVKNTFAATPMPEVREMNNQNENTAIIADNIVEETQQ